MVTKVDDDNPGSRRRHEPGRRDRIIDVTLDRIAEHGIAGATYRTVAEAAGVPLGSMTYHFPSRDDLLFAAFSRFADESFSPLDHGMSEGDPVEALTQIVMQEDGRHTRVLLAELYVVAFREERYAELMRQWMRRARVAIGARVPGVDPGVLDAVQEGLGLHRWFLPNDITDESVRGTFRTLVATVPRAGATS